MLTRQNSGNYSVRMLDRLDALETKLTQLLERYQAAREDNVRLRQEVLGLENANKTLATRLTETRERLETLYNKIPD